MRFVRAAGALTALVALLGGVPWLLITTVGNPWPAEGISIMAPLTDNAIVGLLAVLVWALWAQFVVCVAVETAAILRDRHTDIRVPASFGLQGLARILVSAVAFAVIAVPTAASASGGGADLVDEPSSTSSSQTAPVANETQETEAPSSGGEVETPDEVEEPAAKSTTSVTVHRGDSLWSLAEKHLGDGERFVDIVELNEGKSMSDGSTFRSAAAIQPGWVLEMPADASNVDAPVDADVDGEYTVKPNDTLIYIAKDQLGDAGAYQEIYEASKDIVQPGGRHLSDPDHIEPGWKLNLGAAAETPQEPAPAPEAEPPAPQEAPPAPDVDEDSQQAPEAPRSDVSDAEGAQEAAPVFNAADTGAQADAGEEDGDSVGGFLMSRNGIGVFLAAGLIALLGVRRRRQQKKRKPGQRIPKPSEEASQVEYELRSVADQQMPQLLQTMLRALAATYATTGLPMPAVRAARVSSEKVELYLSAAAELPAPWTRLDDDSASWVSELAVNADVDVEAVPDPYPLLVTTGLDAEDAIVLVNLEDVGPFGVGGAARESLQILAATGAEICTAPWAGDVQVSFVEGWSELAAVLPGERCRYVPSVDELERTDGLQVAVLGADVEDEPLTRLRAAGYVVLHAGRSDGWGLQVEDEHDATLQPLGLQVRPQLLTDADYRLLAEVLGTALQEPPAGPTGPVAAPAPETAPEADLSVPSEPVDVQSATSPAAFATGRTATLEREDLDEAHVDEETVEEHQDQADVVDEVLEQETVEVLRDPISIESRQEPVDRVPSFDVDELLSTGHPVLRMMTSTFEVRGVNQDDPRAPMNRRIIGYIALHPGAGRQQLAEVIWDEPKSPSTVTQALSRARGWVGVHPETGEKYVQRTRIDEAVVSDWTVFNRLVGADVTRAGSEDLEKALALVDGRPFEGEDFKVWTFVDMASQDMIAGIVDAAYELAKRRFLEGRWRSVKHYAAIAAMLEPVNESVWRLWIHACHASRDAQGVAETIDRMHARISHLGEDLEPETTDLLAALDEDDTTSIEQSRRAL